MTFMIDNIKYDIITKKCVQNYIFDDNLQSYSIDPGSQFPLYFSATPPSPSTLSGDLLGLAEDTLVA